MKPCIIDASSAILLFKAELISDLVSCYDTRMAASVYREITVNGYAGAESFREILGQGLIRVHSIPEGDTTTMDSSRYPGGLGPGELETIMLHENGIGDFIIIDDRRGAAWCRSHGIPYINALLVPRILMYADRLCPERAESAFAHIISKGRYSEKIRLFAASATGSQLSRFFPSG